MSPLTPHQFEFTSSDGLQIACSRWSNRNPHRGLLQIAHGMGEHIGRYQTLIEKLVHAGLVVYGNDHRGHGRTARSPGELGDFGPGGFNLLVEDMARLSAIAKKENPKQPLLVLGHSMGSFAAQQYVLNYSGSIDGLVLSGSGALDMLGGLAKSAWPEGVVLNASLPPVRAKFDWLSRNPAVGDGYIKDPLCFGALQPASMKSFLASASQLADLHRLRGIRPDLPVYLFSGSEDPIGQKLQGLRTLIERYHKAGILQVQYKFYTGGSHDMINEPNRKEVITDLLLWISAILHW